MYTTNIIASTYGKHTYTAVSTVRSTEESHTSTITNICRKQPQLGRSTPRTYALQSSTCVNLHHYYTTILVVHYELQGDALNNKRMCTCQHLSLTWLIVSITIHFTPY